MTAFDDYDDADYVDGCPICGQMMEYFPCEQWWTLAKDASDA